MEDYPYLYFEQDEGSPVAFAEEALADVPRAKSIACTDRASLSELIVALNGYTVTSGILVGISDGAGLNTVPLETDVKLHLGYVVKKGAALERGGPALHRHAQEEPGALRALLAAQSVTQPAPPHPDARAAKRGASKERFAGGCRFWCTPEQAQAACPSSASGQVLAVLAVVRLVAGVCPRPPFRVHLFAAFALGARLAGAYAHGRFLGGLVFPGEFQADADVLRNQQYQQDAHHDEIADDRARQPGEVHQQDGNEQREAERDDVQPGDGASAAAAR